MPTILAIVTAETADQPDRVASTDASDLYSQKLHPTCCNMDCIGQDEQVLEIDRETRFDMAEAF